MACVVVPSCFPSGGSACPMVDQLQGIIYGVLLESSGSDMWRAACCSCALFFNFRRPAAALMCRLGRQSRSAGAASRRAVAGYFDSLRAEVAQDRVRVTVAHVGKRAFERNFVCTHPNPIVVCTMFLLGASMTPQSKALLCQVEDGSKCHRRASCWLSTLTILICREWHSEITLHDIRGQPLDAMLG